MKKISTVKHYKRMKNGSLRFVGFEHVEVEEAHVTRFDGLAERDEADALCLARDIEEFEALVDAASVCGE